MENEVYESVITDLAENGYSVTEFFFPEKTLSALRNRLLRKDKEEKLKRAGIGNKDLFTRDTAIRRDLIQWLEEKSEIPEEQDFFRHIEDFYSYLNRTCFTGISGSEFHYACFDKGAFYKRHVDRFQNDDRRKFSVVTYLNKRWDESLGGQLVIYHADKTVLVPPRFGTTVIFPSDSLEHEVLTSHYKRLSITGWLT